MPDFAPRDPAHPAPRRPVPTRRGARPARPALAGVVTLSALLLAAGCAADGSAPPTSWADTRTDPGSAAGVAFTLPRRIAVVAPVLVIPLTVDGAGTPRTPAVLDAQGRPLPAAIVRLGVRPDPVSPPGLGRWMARPGTWLSLPPARAAELPAGIWVLRLDLRSVTPGSAVTLDGDPLPLDWLVPDEHAGRQILVDAALAQPLEPGQADAVAAMIEPMLASPLERWRAEALVAASLRAGAVPAPRNPGAREAAPRGTVRVRRPADSVVDEFAEQTRRRWLAALGRLAEVDLALAEQVAARMVGLVRFDLADDAAALADRGLVVPVWPAVSGGSVSVADDLLDPRADRDRLVAAARALLGELPAAVCWTIDDAGAPAGASREVRRPVLGVANLSGVPAPVSVAAAGPDSGSALRRLEPGHAAAIGVAVPTPDQPAATLRARIGSSAHDTQAQGQPLPAAPPGIAISPLAADWTMSSWLASAPELDTALAARLYRRPASPEGPAAWVLFLDARLPPGTDPGDDRVRIAFGPTGRGTVLALRGDGTLAPTTTTAPDTTLRHARTPAGWSAWVPVPPAAIEPGGLLRLGLERTDPAGRRAAWPRPMLPWQQETGRALIDLSTWPE